MEFNRINELRRIRRLGTGAPWTQDPAADLKGPAPETLEAAMARGRHLHAMAIRGAFAAAWRAFRRVPKKVLGLGRASRRLVPALPTGAHGPEAVNFDCAHGRPC